MGMVYPGQQLPWEWCIHDNSYRGNGVTVITVPLGMGVRSVTWSAVEVPGVLPITVTTYIACPIADWPPEISDIYVYRAVYGLAN